MQEKIQIIKELFGKYQKFAITFSGGIDSSLLLYLAATMYPERTLAVTVNSATLAAEERERIDEFVVRLGVKHTYIDIDELENKAFVANDKNKCYYCKSKRIEQLANWARQHDVQIMFDGSNTDDLSDYRPGMRAMQEAKELLASPFLLAAISKSDIRQLAKEYGIEFWDLPSSACLASRIEYGLEITAERLRQVDEAEKILKQYFSGAVRLRHHGQLARIELEPQEFAKVLDVQLRQHLVSAIKQLGFTFVTLDLNGYQTGSMNSMPGVMAESAK